MPTDKISIARFVWRAWWENMDGWIGEAVYDNEFSAKLWVPEEYKEFQQEAAENSEDYRPGVFSWVPIGKFMFHLYEDDAPTGVVIQSEEVYKVTPR